MKAITGCWAGELLYTSLGDWTKVANAVRQDSSITDEVRRREMGIITVRAEQQRRAVWQQQGTLKP
jgi:hypothetical protein